MREQLSKYALKAIFNAEEFELNYRMAQDTKIAFQRIYGNRKAKERSYALACAHADGSKNLELLVIGNSFKPRADSFSELSPTQKYLPLWVKFFYVIYCNPLLTESRRPHNKNENQ